MKRILPFLVIVLLAGGCSKRHQPFTPTEVSFPSAPKNLLALVGDREVTLIWSDQQEVRGFYIYRADSLRGEFTKIDSTQRDSLPSTSYSYRDSGLLNNREYFYKVSAYNNQGYEGNPTPVISATPSAYDLIIEGGKEFTNHQDVSLTLTAPQGATLMMLANDSTFTASSWEPFSPEKEWRLTEGDGEKRVFVKFKDSKGIETENPASDKITLDTQAAIRTVSEDSEGKRLSPGDTIHFRLDAGEPNGKATIDIGTAQIEIVLEDSANGIYASDFIIPGGLEVLQARVVGHFTDRAGNQATPVNTQGTLTIQSPPPPVELRSPTPVGNSTTSLNLSWSPSSAEDFASYMLFRAEEPGVDSTSSLVTTITDRNTTSFEDTGLKENTDYWYRLYVFDQSGLSSASKPVKGTTKENEPPKPVILYPPSPIVGSFSQLSLRWSQNSDEDFASYELYRSQDPGVDSASTLVATITSQTTTAYQDTGLKENTTYWYRVYVWDRGGLGAPSNEEVGRTNQDEPPEPVILYPPSPIVGSFSQLNLSWSQNSDEDFASYNLYRSESSGVDSTSTLVATITSQTTTAYQDTGLKENTGYYYRLYVRDKGGHSSRSNEEMGKTNPDEPPEPVTLYQPNAVSATRIDLSWSQNSDDDFASYRLFRSPSSGVDSASYQVVTIEDRFQLTYQDTALTGNKTYYYRLFVYDQGGKGRGSNEVSATTENSPPEAVVLEEVTVLDSSSLGLSWSRNEEDDFQSYRVYRSRHSGVNLSSELIEEITDPSHTSLVDSGLTDNREYWYRIYVFDQKGLWAGSNEVSGTTDNSAPHPVFLSDPQSQTENSLTLSWTENSDWDFSSYRIYRSPNQGVSSGSQLVAQLPERTSTTYQDTGLAPNTTYYYRVYVVDTGDKASGSNEVSGTTLENLPPQPVVLAQPVVEDSITLRLSWSESQANDFATYRIFRSSSSPVDTNAAPIYIINTREITEYLDTRLNMGETYFYRVFVYDQGDLSAGSNEVSGTPSKGK